MATTDPGGAAMFTASMQYADEGPAAFAGGIDFSARPPAVATPVRTPPPDTADAALVAELAQVARGDQRAFERLYDATLARVYAVVRRVVFDPGLAEEVVEDVYFQVWRQAGAYDASRGVVLAWLLMMTRSRALDALRRSDPALLSDDPHALAAAGDESAEAAGTRDPGDLIDAVRRDSATRAALARVPARDRQLLALAFMRGLTHAEIAGQTRLPLGTVKTSIRRALQTMRAALAELAPAGADLTDEGWNHDAD